MRHTFILPDNLLFSVLDYRYVNCAKTLNIHLRYVKKSELVGDEEYNRKTAETHTENETCSDLALYCTHDSGNVWGWNVRAMT